MTFREKLAKEHPDRVNANCWGGCFGCPHEYGYEAIADKLCGERCRDSCPELCTKCWDRKIPGSVESDQDMVDALVRGPDAMRHFSSGAVRDSAAGKGRFVLLPWGAIHALARHCERGAEHYGERNVDKGIPQHSLVDSGLRHLGLYIQGDVEPHHLVAALWNIAWAVEQEIKRPDLVDLPERTGVSGDPV